MQTLNNIPSDYRLTNYLKPFYEAYSVKALPSRLKADTRLARVLNIVNAKARKPLLSVTPPRWISIRRKYPFACRGQLGIYRFQRWKELPCDSHTSGKGGICPTPRLHKRSE